MAFTLFFRDLQMLELAIDYVAPELAGRSRPKIWDAGCAHEESFAAPEKICARDIRTIYFGHGRRCWRTAISGNSGPGKS